MLHLCKEHEPCEETKHLNLDLHRTAT